jgi:hypothetical protein
VTQIRLFGGRCACCGARVTAQAPTGLEQGSPFGHSVLVNLSLASLSVAGACHQQQQGRISVIAISAPPANVHGANGQAR